MREVLCAIAPGSLHAGVAMPKLSRECAAGVDAAFHAAVRPAALLPAAEAP